MTMTASGVFSHKGKICIKVVPLCKLHLVAASRSYTCAQGGLDTVQLALVVFLLPPTSKNTPLSMAMGSQLTFCAYIREPIIYL